MTFREIQSEILKEKLYIKTLDNGLKIYIIPKKGYNKKYAIFGTHYGSIDNKFKVSGSDEIYEVPEGIAHFLEHKLFEDPEGGVFERFSKLGSSVNAYTNFNSTCYLFSATDNFNESLEILIDFVQSPYLTEENVEKEKGIIEQEIRMYEDNPHWRVFFNALKCLYHDHPVKIDIAGTVESIYKITKDDLIKCYNTFYVPNNMVVVIVGDVDKDECAKIIEKNLKESFIKNNSNKVERLLPNEKEEVNQEKIEEYLSISMPIFNIAFKDTETSLRGRELLRKEIEIKTILEMVFGNSSKLYRELYNQGLINETFENEYSYDLTYGHSMIGGESKDPEKVYELIIKEIKNIKEKGLDKESFNRIKKKSIGVHLNSFNSVEYIANNFISYYFKGINFFDYIEELNKLDFDKVTERFHNHFSPEKSVISIVYPN